MVVFKTIINNLFGENFYTTFIKNYENIVKKLITFLLFS